MILYRDSEAAAIACFDMRKVSELAAEINKEAAGDQPRTGATGSSFLYGGYSVDIDHYIRQAESRQYRQRGQPDPAELWERVQPLIPKGEGSAIPARALAERLGISERQLRAQIRLLRRWGAPILSSRDNQRGGYFTAASTDEAAHAINSLRSQAFDLLRTAAALSKRVQVDGQAELTNGGG